MSLSTPLKEDIAKLDSVLELLPYLKILTNGNELESIIKKYHGLTEEEKAKAEVVRKEISSYEALIEDCRKKNALLQEFHSALERQKSEQDEEFSKRDRLIMDKHNELDAYKARLDEYSADLKKIEDSLIQQKKTLESRELSIESEEKSQFEAREKITKDQEFILAEKKSLAEYSASLKEKAVQLQKVAEGL